jgi:hypothetical protein
MSLDRKNRFLSRLVIDAGKADFWEDMFVLLEAYVNREGHCNVPISHKEVGENLGKWVANQRHAKKKGWMSRDKACRLEDLGMVSDKLEAQWGDTFALLETYAKRERHCNVPCDHKGNGASLGQWVSFQRKLKKKEMLPADRKRRLEDLGIVGSQDMFALLETYVQREGHCNVPRSNTEFRAKLGNWVSSQRATNTNDNLSADRKRRLEGLGIVWVPLESQWEANFALLETYVKREGHCIVPQSHKEDGTNLGHWVSDQRVSKRKGGLSADKVRRLEELGIAWDIAWAQIEAKWEHMFVLLETYVQREGHCNVPAIYKEDGTNLGNWVSNQRVTNTNDNLSADRKRRLEGLGIVWEPREAQWEDNFDLLGTYVKREGHCIVPKSWNESWRVVPKTTRVKDEG